MGLIKKFYSNTARPEGFLGSLMVSMMNSGKHSKLAEWGLGHLKLRGDEVAADIGCGGGENLARLCDLLPEGMVIGIDRSEVSVEKSIEVNRRAIEHGRCCVINGEACDLPLEDRSADLITAFETVYFWEDIYKCFAEVYRVLKAGGRFVIVNEADGKHEKDLKWTHIVEGMHIYNGEELTMLIKDAGFRTVTADDDESGDRLYVEAVK